MDAVRFPPSLGVGSVVAVVAPAGGFDREELFRGLAWLQCRYRLSIDGRILTREGYLAGADAARAATLTRAMLDPEVDGIACARGGYGTTRILEQLPWDAFVARPKWVFGFSDVTALHVELTRRGIASVHGPNVTGLGRPITPRERASLIASLEGRRPRGWAGGASDVVVRGRVHGPLFGGNLALVEAMAAAGRLLVPRGAILALEDVTEAPYRVDRMLTSLLLGGHLARAAAIVFGGFTRCEPGPDGVTVDDVLRERTSGLAVPVVRGAPFGHGARNEAFPVGGNAQLLADDRGWRLEGN